MDGRTVRGGLVAAGWGAVAWTAAEYLLHRFAMHEMRGRGLASVEHLRHHADVTYFSPASKKLASAATTTAVVLPVATRLVGPARARPFAAGMVATYFGYEVAHRRTHTHPPRGRFGRWARKHHLHHHFGAPMRNFGVTSPVWDRVFRTDVAVDVVTVPRRMAPTWLLDDRGEVRPEHVGDYVVKGRARPDAATAERDRIDAFANVAPVGG